ncbi:dipeptidase 1-like [Bacillus rossius redtenbacheri]|uniref:dipeptidase 1-like n=1 Tax=Bacillus rossius redtenbacheri TaxID=93214 RepID=UPI002FDD7B3A
MARDKQQGYRAGRETQPGVFRVAAPSSVPRLWWYLAGAAAALLCVTVVVLSVVLPGLQSGAEAPLAGARVLDVVPLIDGHNDLPWNLRTLAKDQLRNFSFDSDLSRDPVWNCSSCFTDLPRLRRGKVGGQFWVAYVSCSSQYKDAVEQTLEQIDVIKRLVKAYPDDLQYADSVQGVWDAFKAGKIASLIAIEGGHSIDSRLAVLRLMYEAGGRYLTLTHTCNTPWAAGSPVDAAVNNSEYTGLTEYGKIVVKELNRLGMMVDLSHVSKQTMVDAIGVSEAPVIFSHSSAWTLCNHHRNVQDDVLGMLAKNNGIVMVNFYTEFVACNGTNATLETVVEHINHIRTVAGVDHVGIGSDYDGVNSVPAGLEDVSKYPDLFDRLADARPGEPTWTAEDLKKLAGLNLLRVMADVEEVRDRLAAEGVQPYEDRVPAAALCNNTDCRTDL